VTKEAAGGVQIKCAALIGRRIGDAKTIPVALLTDPVHVNELSAAPFARRAGEFMASACATTIETGDLLRAAHETSAITDRAVASSHGAGIRPRQAG
jgi:hypothetical protein